MNTLLLLFPIFYIYFLKRSGGILQRLLLGTILFLGLNSAYFFVVYVLNLRVNLSTLLVCHIIYSLILFRKKEDLELKKTTDHSYNNIGILLVVGVLAAAFIFSTRSFNNGKRLPIFSYTQDAAYHYQWTRNIFETDKISRPYPHAFHGNVWILEKLSQPFLSNKSNQVWFVNIFSLSIVFLTFLYGGLFQTLVSVLINKKGSVAKEITISLLTVFFGLITCYYYIFDGFFSNWLSHIFILAIVIFYFQYKKSVYFNYFLTPLIFGAAYSYIYAFPALGIFFVLNFFVNKKHFYPLFIFGVIICIYFIRYYFHTGIPSLAAMPGAFVDFTLIQLLTYSIFALTFLYDQHHKKKVQLIARITLSFLIYSLALYTFQIITTGTAQYAFYKSFSYVMVLLSILCISGTITFIENIYRLWQKNKEMALFCGLVAVIVIFKIFNSISPYNIFSLAKGNHNFFQNNSEKYNSVILATEKYKDYDRYIYIDPDFSSGQWSYIGFFMNRLNMTNLNTGNGYVASSGDMSKYIDFLKTVNINEKVMVIDPLRYLEVNCEAKKLVAEFTTNKNINIFPAYDPQHRKQNCPLN